MELVLIDSFEPSVPQLVATIHHAMLFRRVRVCILPSFFGILQLQPDLRQQAHQQFVHVVIDADGSLDEFAVVSGRHRFTLCKGNRNIYGE